MNSEGENLKTRNPAVRLSGFCSIQVCCALSEVLHYIADLSTWAHPFLLRRDNVSKGGW